MSDSIEVHASSEYALVSIKCPNCGKRSKWDSRNQNEGQYVYDLVQHMRRRSCTVELACKKCGVQLRIQF